jgi:hypothetical protein
LKLWLEGSDKAGLADTFIGQLPGAPDGLSQSLKKIVAKVSSPLGKLAPHPSLRQLVGSLLVPCWLPQLSKLLMGSTAAIQVDDHGEVLQVLLNPKSESLHSISVVTEIQGDLFFGSFNGNYVSVMKVND